jgi:hypothetical protein
VDRKRKKEGKIEERERMTTGRKCLFRMMENIDGHDFTL